ncbi:MAG: hypothetical protein U1E65_33045 [Myxococcota bacterium]
MALARALVVALTAAAVGLLGARAAGAELGHLGYFAHPPGGPLPTAELFRLAKTLRPAGLTWALVGLAAAASEALLFAALTALARHGNLGLGAALSALPLGRWLRGLGIAATDALVVAALGFGVHRLFGWLGDAMKARGATLLDRIGWVMVPQAALLLLLLGTVGAIGLVLRAYLVFGDRRHLVRAAGAVAWAVLRRPRRGLSLVVLRLTPPLLFTAALLVCLQDDPAWPGLVGLGLMLLFFAVLEGILWAMSLATAGKLLGEAPHLFARKDRGLFRR